MKQLLLILLFFHTKCVSAQQIDLQGIYGASFIGGERINFVGKDSFYFNGFYCTDGVFGKGLCEIRNNNLYLFFEKYPNNKRIDSLKKPIITSSQSSDSIAEIKITSLDNNGLFIPYTTISLIMENTHKWEALTDTFGTVTIRLKNEFSPITIKSWALGFEGPVLKLDAGTNYNIKLFHKRDNSFMKELNNGEVFIYEIDELSQDLILMRPEHSSERFRRYIKEK